jgi:hypothetical protein
MRWHKPTLSFDDLCIWKNVFYNLLLELNKDEVFWVGLTTGTFQLTN